MPMLRVCAELFYTAQDSYIFVHITATYTHDLALNLHACINKMVIRSYVCFTNGCFVACEMYSRSVSF